MKILGSLVAVSVFAVFAVGCGTGGDGLSQDPSQMLSSAVASDGGVSSGCHVPEVDAGTANPGIDAGTGESDAGTAPLDAGTAPVDAGTPANVCAANYAGCTTFVDATAAAASRDINFAFSPNPRCLQIKAGQTVRFTGTPGPSSLHPLSQHCGPQVIPAHTTVSPASFTLNAPGDYGYFCDNHGVASTGSGMAGVVRVVP